MILAPASFGRALALALTLFSAVLLLTAADTHASVVLPLTKRTLPAGSAPLFDGRLVNRRGEKTPTRRAVDVKAAQNEQHFFTVPYTVGSTQTEAALLVGCSVSWLEYGAYKPSGNGKNLATPLSTVIVNAETLFGRYWTDTHTLGGLTAEGAPLHQMYVFSAGQMQVPGYACLGYPDPTLPDVADSLMGQLVAQGKLPNGGFVIDYGKDAGTLTLDDAGKDRPGMQFAPVPNVTIGWSVDAVLTANSTSKLTLVPEPGFPAIILPVSQVKEVAASLGLETSHEGESGYTATIVGDCKKEVKIEWEMKGTDGKFKVKILPEFLWMPGGPIKDGPHKGKCISVLAGSDQLGDGVWFAGNPFFQSVLVAYEYVGQRIGFAQKEG